MRSAWVLPVDAYTHIVSSARSAAPFVLNDPPHVDVIRLGAVLFKSVVRIDVDLSDDDDDLQFKYNSILCGDY